MGLTDWSASIPHCFALWREQGSYALRDWKEAAGCLNHHLHHSSQLRWVLGPLVWWHLISVHLQEKPGQGHQTWRAGTLCVSDYSHTVMLMLRKVAWHLQEMITGCVLAWEVTIQRWQRYSSWENCTAGKAWLCRGADRRDKSLASACDAQSWFRRLCFLGGLNSESSM